MRESINSFFGAIRRSWKTALLIAVVAMTAVAVSALVSFWLSKYHNLRFPSIGTIHTAGVEACWDQDLTNRTTRVEWGTLYPDTRTNITVYLHSVSNIPTTLTLKTENWTYINSAGTSITEPPNRQNYMDLTWNYSNQTLNPDETIQITLTLTVTDDPTFIEYLIQNNITTYNFDIRISTTETP
jgi:hypothetical protein